jgi:hypothetical protein
MFTNEMGPYYHGFPTLFRHSLWHWAGTGARNERGIEQAKPGCYPGGADLASSMTCSSE